MVDLAVQSGAVKSKCKLSHEYYRCQLRNTHVAHYQVCDLESYELPPEYIGTRPCAVRHLQEIFIMAFTPHLEIVLNAYSSVQRLPKS